MPQLSFDKSRSDNTPAEHQGPPTEMVQSSAIQAWNCLRMHRSHAFEHRFAHHTIGIFVCFPASAAKVPRLTDQCLQVLQDRLDCWDASAMPAKAPVPFHAGCFAVRKDDTVQPKSARRTCAPPRCRPRSVLQACCLPTGQMKLQLFGAIIQQNARQLYLPNSPTVQRCAWHQYIARSCGVKVRLPLLCSSTAR
jgi:hypothetical protein